MSLDLDTLSLTEIIRLQTELSGVLERRFGRSLALAFTDIVGSTQYFRRFGDAAGKALHQLHLDLLSQVVAAGGGRIVDTAGDGAFTCFPSAAAALDALERLMLRVSEHNAGRTREHQLRLRLGLHWGRVLTDGVLVTGDAVNLAARIAGCGEPGELRLSKDALVEATNDQRVRCRPLPAVSLKGIDADVRLFYFDWRQEDLLPASVFVVETGQELPLPKQDLVAFGRLREAEGMPANDIVLSLGDPDLDKALSRWHFELRRRPEGYALRTLSRQLTEVDGQPVVAGHEAIVRPGSVVRLSQVLTLEFRASPTALAFASDATVGPGRA